MLGPFAMRIAISGDLARAKVLSFDGARGKPRQKQVIKAEHILLLCIQ